MRGFRVGGACVSEKHCNFLINDRDATAEDIETLGETVRARVKSHLRRRPAMGDQARRRAAPGPPDRRGPGAVGAAYNPARKCGGGGLLLASHA